MEKLIELLLEYKPQIHYLDKPKGLYDKKYGIGWYKREGDIGGWFSEEVIISKKFGFIEWLVENNKIDYQKSPGEIMFDDRMGTVYDKTDSTLMMLAIQDNPIEYLLSVIK